MRCQSQSHSQSQKQQPDIHKLSSDKHRVSIRRHVLLKGFSLLISFRVMAIPVSDCEVRDPRQKRTRKLLQDALRELLQEKPFEEILVQDIAEAATVNRA